MAGDVEIPGLQGSRFVGIVEIIFGFTSLAWYTELIWDPTELFASFKQFYHGIDEVKRVFFTGMYLLSSLIMPVFLIYSTFNHANLSQRKSIAVTWRSCRGFSFITVVCLLYAKRTMNKVWYSVMSAFLVFSVASIFIVTMYVGGLKDALGYDRPPPVIKRKVSSVAILNAEGEDGCVADLTEDHVRQLDQFRAYVHRTSWCSETGNDRPQKSSNTLAVPVECRF